MKSLEISFRPLMISAVLLLLVVGLAPQSSLAQTVSASPGYLTFGIPTGTSPAVSAAETVDRQHYWDHWGGGDVY